MGRRLSPGHKDTLPPKTAESRSFFSLCSPHHCCTCRLQPRQSSLRARAGWPMERQAAQVAMAASSRLIGFETRGAKRTATVARLAVQIGRLH